MITALNDVINQLENIDSNLAHCEMIVKRLEMSNKDEKKLNSASRLLDDAEVFVNNATGLLRALLSEIQEELYQKE